MSAIVEAIQNLAEGNLPSGELCRQVAAQMLGGEATDAQIGAFLLGMRIRGEGAEQLAAFASAMREFATPIVIDNPESAVDIVGTGGVDLGQMNVSSASAIVAAGAGARVAKHGNRAVTSRPGSGAADVLGALGIKIDCSPETTAHGFATCGLAFFFAPAYHGAMRHVGPARKQLGTRSMFNLLGPLANPARVGRQVIGVARPELTETFAEVLKELGLTHAMVVHGTEGLDEISLTGTTRVSELKNGKITTWTLDPRELGLELCTVESIQGGEGAEGRAATIRGILTGVDHGPRRDLVRLNAAAGLVVSGRAEDLAGGLELAAEAIDSGAALKTLEILADVTHSEAPAS